MRRIWLILCLCLALLWGQSALAQTQNADNYLGYGKAVAALSPVSYTHLDVYKRQVYAKPG